MTESSIDSFDFNLPPDRIAVSPANPRESAKLLIYDRTSKSISHKQVSDITRWLSPGNLLILNNTKVDPVRVEWKKKEGGACELFLLRLQEDFPSHSNWEALIAGRNLKTNETYNLPAGLQMKILSRGDQSNLIQLSKNDREIRTWLENVGKVPIPPYIRKTRANSGMSEDSPEDKIRYQTEFAEVSGAVAAPTAGLHFSRELLERIRSVGVEIEFVTLAVGWGTFQPLTKDHWREGKLHPEWVEVSRGLAEKIQRTKTENRNVIAVGTTVVRALEWWKGEGCPSSGGKGWCEVFIRPPWRSEIIDGLVTNFHLPGSSLMALVAAFLGENGIETLQTLYKEAIAREYRFYSYGDAMFIKNRYGVPR